MSDLGDFGGLGPFGEDDDYLAGLPEGIVDDRYIFFHVFNSHDRRMLTQAPLPGCSAIS